MKVISAHTQACTPANDTLETSMLVSLRFWHLTHCGEHYPLGSDACLQ